MKRGPVFTQNSVQLLHKITVFVVGNNMKTNFLLLMPIIFGVIAGDYVETQNGFRNGNGNAYGVPGNSITPPQPQGGPYPPSGWKPAGRRLFLPGENRGAQLPIDSGYGQPPPPQYGPVNPSPTRPPIDFQYGPSVDNTSPPNNQYIPGTGFGSGGHSKNGFSNGNGHNGNGNGQGNGNGNNHNGNGSGNVHGTSNGHGGGNGFSATGNGNGNGSGNGFNGNGFGATGNGNGNGNGNGHNGGNGFSNGIGQNGNNGNGNKGSNGANGSSGFAPAFHGAFPAGVIYPFVQHSVPAVFAFRPSNGAGHGSVFPLYQVPIVPSQSGTGIIASSFGQGIFPLINAFPTQNFHGTPDLSSVHPGIHLTATPDVAGSHPVDADQGTGLTGNGIGQLHAFLLNHQSQKSNILGVQNGLTNLQLQYPAGHGAYGNAGVPLGVF